MSKMGKMIVCFCFLIFAAESLAAQEVTKKKTGEQTSRAEFDGKLAERLGADQYGMKSYVLVTLITGKEKIEAPEENKKIFAGHFANMKRLAADGKLVLAGPFMESAPKRGLFILNTDSIEAAKKWVKTDPAVKAGVFDFELNKIYCSAALMKINEIHKTIQKTPIQ